MHAGVLERVADQLTVRHRACMPRGYSRDLRESVLHAVASGMLAGEIQARFGVSVSRQQRYKRKHATGASLEAGTSPGGSERFP